MSGQLGNQQITFEVTSKLANIRLFYRFVTYDGRYAWPANQQVYYIDEFMKEQTHTLTCNNRDELVCVGAWTLTNNTEGAVWKEWYSGYMGQGNRTEKCYPCQGQIESLNPAIQGSVGLTNRTNRTIYYQVYYIGTEDTAWRDGYIKSGQSLVFAQNGQPAVEIKFYTANPNGTANGKLVHYILSPARNYYIDWNPSKGMEDIYPSQ